MSLKTDHKKCILESMHLERLCDSVERKDVWNIQKDDVDTHIEQQKFIKSLFRQWVQGIT